MIEENIRGDKRISRDLRKGVLFDSIFMGSLKAAWSTPTEAKLGDICKTTKLTLAATKTIASCVYFKF